MAPTYHMLSTLGIRKEAIARTLGATENHDEHWQQAMELVKRRTQSYTLVELRLLLSFYLTASDECTDEFPEEYTPLEVYASRAKIARYDAALAVLNELEGDFAPNPDAPFPQARVEIGPLTLVWDDEKADMTGGKFGPHTIYRAGMLRQEWAKRVKAHWEGYCHNNGVTL